MMRPADDPCILTREPVTAIPVTGIIVLHKDVPAAPAWICRNPAHQQP
jgi:hypothetical protein